MAERQLPYYTIEGRDYPRVTTVLRSLSKPALTAWAAKVAAERAMPYILGEALTPEFRSDADIEDFRKHLSAASRDPSAREHGTAVHKLIEEYVTGGDPEPANRDELDKLEKFVAWEQEAGFNPVLSEVRVVNKDVGYAGTLDLIGYGPAGVLQILDVKTGGVWPDAALQLAAYRYATHYHEEAWGDDAEAQPIAELVGDQWDSEDFPVGVLRIPADEPASVHYVTDIHFAYQTFKHLLAVSWWVKDKDQKLVERPLI